MQFVQRYNRIAISAPASKGRRKKSNDCTRHSSVHPITYVLALFRLPSTWCACLQRTRYINPGQGQNQRPVKKEEKCGIGKTVNKTSAHLIAMEEKTTDDNKDDFTSRVTCRVSPRGGNPYNLYPQHHIKSHPKPV